ncbi:MAG: shikimate kinase [Planctomycetota bacterium]
MQQPASHILLIGYRGSGKSTVGKILANALRYDFVDTDDIVEATAGSSIAAIFERDGESAFRDLETEAIRSCTADESKTVISLGGGAILREENRHLLRTAGFVVWLQGSAENLFQRISQDTTSASRRPKLLHSKQEPNDDRDGYAEVVEILRVRTPIYSSLANFTVETDDKDPEDIVEEIIQSLKYSV